MNIREAILKAADHIERNPLDFDFWKTGVPGSCGTPGCALGWIGHFMGETNYFNDVCDVMGLGITKPHLPERGEFDFYRRMDKIEGPAVLHGKWTNSAELCARTLRLYADKYHPAESRAVIPASVMRIFQMSHAELSKELA